MSDNVRHALCFPALIQQRNKKISLASKLRPPPIKQPLYLFEKKLQKTNKQRRYSFDWKQKEQLNVRV